MHADEQAVRIRRQVDMNEFKIPLEKLSEEDRLFLRRQLREPRRSDGLKSGPYASLCTGTFQGSVSKQGLNFQFFGDPKFDPEKRYPLVVSLHGGGQSGTDNESQMIGTPKHWADEAAQKKHPCFMLVPQSPTQQKGWSGEVGPQVMALLGDLVENLPIDENRLYVTGHSMGGSGTYHLVGEHPKAWAAAAPLCGVGNLQKIDQYKQVPFYIFHGELDPGTPAEKSREMYAALQKIGANCRYLELKGAPHVISNLVYPKPELHEWLFAQQKGQKEKP